jgi:hypothetical protein
MTDDTTGAQLSSVLSEADEQSPRGELLSSGAGIGRRGQRVFADNARKARRIYKKHRASMWMPALNQFRQGPPSLPANTPTR